MATLYRKYRSKRFDEVIGQQPIVTTLTNQIKLGRIGHAYLFTGSRGTGKTTCARIFARAVNCLSPVDGSPCGECEVCKKLAAPDNVDVIEMDAASNNGVDDAREIREKVNYLPVSCKYKVYIIDEVHMLTGGAFNALLKTIEEPPEHVIFILATTEPQKLPQTILSRCIRFDFKLVETPVIAKHIAKIYDAEGVKYTPEATEEIARLGEGSVRDALSVADTIMSAADVITPELVLKLTGAGDRGRIAELFDAAAARDLPAALRGIDGFAKDGSSMSAVAAQLTRYARNALVVKSVGAANAESLVNADKASYARLTASAERATLADISNILESFSAAESGLKYSVDPRVYLETAFVKLIGGANEEDDLRKRVAALERRLSVANGEQKKNNVETPPAVKQTASAQKSEAACPEPNAASKAAEQYAPPAAPKSVQPVQPTAPSVDEFAGLEPPPPEFDGAPPAYKQRQVVKPQTAESPRRSDERAVPQTRAASPKSAKPEDGAEQVKSADEGEFMHMSAQGANGLALLGRLSTYLRKKGTADAARARELLSRDVSVKERADYIAFVTRDEDFLSMTDERVVAELNAALDAAGIKKRARAEKTAEDLYADDLSRAITLFGRDLVTPKA